MCKNCFEQTLYHGTCKVCGTNVTRLENLWTGYVQYTCPKCKKTVESSDFYTVFDDENSNPTLMIKRV